MTKETVTTANDRKELHNWIDTICEADLPVIRWLLQGYVARALNKQYREKQK